MNNIEQPKSAQEPKPVAEILKDSREGVEAWQKSRQARMAQREKAAQGPQSAAERAKEYSKEAEKLGQGIQERRRQREAAADGARPTPEEKPTGVRWESGAEVQKRMEELKKTLEEKSRDTVTEISLKADRAASAEQPKKKGGIFSRFFKGLRGKG